MRSALRSPQAAGRPGDLLQAWLTKQGFPPDCDDEADSDDALALLQAASVEGRLATPGGRHARRTQRVADREVAGSTT